MEKKARIGLIVLLALLVAPALLFSGGQKEKVIELTYWNEFTDGPRLAANEAMIEVFNKENPKYKIVNRPISNEDFSWPCGPVSRPRTARISSSTRIWKLSGNSCATGT